MTASRGLRGLSVFAFFMLVAYNVVEFTMTILPDPEANFLMIISLVLIDIYYLTMIWLVGRIAKLKDRYWKLKELNTRESKLLKSEE